MKSTAAILSFAGAVLAAGVTEDIAPSNSYPSGCSKDFDGDFELSVASVTVSKRDIVTKRSASCGSDGILLVSLAGGVLTDSKNRTGYIASNYQFQFDDPPQDGAIYTAGFSVCGNDSLALGDSTTFWECKSGSFWNLYDRDWAEQCSEVQLLVLPCGSTGGASESSDGQVVATAQRTTTVVQTISDGQVQVVTTTVPVPICQITDGQAQVQTTPCASITSTSVPAAASTAVPISQYSDGQIQVTTPASGAATTAVVATTAAVETTAAAYTTPAAAAGTTAAAGSSAAAGTTAAAGSYAAAGTTVAVGTTAAAGSSAAAGTTAAPYGSSNSSSTSTLVKSATSEATTAGATSGSSTASSSASATSIVSSSAVRMGASSLALAFIGLIGVLSL